MAIVINGSGTVTGLAVGGLPDGTVDAGTLATNSVDSAELIDGAVDNSHINASAAIVGTKLTNTGKVLQVVIAEYASATTLATDTYTDVGLSADITPSATSSKILCMWTTQANLNAASEGWASRLKRGSSVVYADATNYRTYIGTAIDIRLTTPVSHLDSPSSTSAITYTIQVSTYNSNEIIFNNANNKTQLILMEIGA